MARKDFKTSKPAMARAASKYTTYRVTEPGELMDFLMKKMAGISRTRVKALLTNRVVLVDNTIQTLYNYPLQPGMCVQISKEKHKHEFRHPMLKILYEDAYIIVVEKKEGLLSVATERQKERTAQHILNEYVKRIHRGNRIYVVHRLDRETSGIMMYAKDEKTQHTLRDNWHDLVRDRRYVAIVAGDMEQDEGTVRSWLTDRNYGCEVNPLGRLALHAFKLCFYHPVTHEWMEFETPYPAPFKTLMLRR